MGVLEIIKTITGISAIAKLFIKDKDKATIVENVTKSISDIGTSVDKVEGVISDKIPNKKVSKVVSYVITGILVATAIASGYFAIKDPNKADEILSVSSQVVQMLNQYTGEDNGSGVPSP